MWHEAYHGRKPIPVIVLNSPRPLRGEVLVGGEEGLDPAVDLYVAQLERRGPVGVAAPAHMAHFVSAFLERGDPVADECDHGVLVAQPELLQLR